MEKLNENKWQKLNTTNNRRHTAHALLHTHKEWIEWMAAIRERWGIFSSWIAFFRYWIWVVQRTKHTHLFKLLSFWLAFLVHKKKKKTLGSLRVCSKIFCHMKCGKNVRNSTSKIINCSKWKLNRRENSLGSKSVSMLCYSICNTYIFTNISNDVCQSIRLELFKCENETL